MTRNIGRDGLYLEEGAAYISAVALLDSRLASTAELPARRDAKLRKDMSEVSFGGAGGGEEALAYLRVGQPLSRQEGDVAFGFGEARPAGCWSQSGASTPGDIGHGLLQRESFALPPGDRKPFGRESLPGAGEVGVVRSLLGWRPDVADLFPKRLG
jgi:hypothetical protein